VEATAGGAAGDGEGGAKCYVNARKGMNFQGGEIKERQKETLKKGNK
jgi:hypothetical protein